MLRTTLAAQENKSTDSGNQITVDTSQQTRGQCWGQHWLLRRTRAPTRVTRKQSTRVDQSRGQYLQPGAVGALGVLRQERDVCPSTFRAMLQPGRCLQHNNNAYWEDFGAEVEATLICPTSQKNVYNIITKHIIRIIVTFKKIQVERTAFLTHIAHIGKQALLHVTG